ISRLARAQAYPPRPVRIFVGFPAGSGIDRDAHIVGEWLATRLGQSFDIENRLGAGTNIATEAVVRAPPDGYTPLLAHTANAINATLYDRLNFNFVRGIAPVAGLVSVPIVTGQSIVSCQDRSGTHRLCQGQSRQGRYGVALQWHATPFGGRAVQDDHWRRHASRALSWGRARAQRPGRPQGAASIFRPWRDDDGDTHGIFAGRPDGWGFLARLRGDHMAGDRRAQGHARRDYRKAE